jgi:hypothetical protein
MFISEQNLNFAQNITKELSNVHSKMCGLKYEI